MSPKLTAKQELVLDFLKKEIKRRGYPPTVREICDAVGLRSTSTVHAHLETLERKGFIRRSPAKNRTTEILDEDFYSLREVSHIPVLGRVAEGLPLLAEENIEDTFPIPIDYVKNAPCFMLHAKGDTMKHEGILDGDLVLVRQQPSANDGDLVAVRAGETIRIMRQKGTAATPTTHAGPVFRTRPKYELLGKVIGLYRRY
ncbi:MAG: transcriptional repressor LexA [Defluviitaleaceae bacterium]|nr:transcriptional repressor LexA [Defluviitaleaceae bacterium]